MATDSAPLNGDLEGADADMPGREEVNRLRTQLAELEKGLIVLAYATWSEQSYATSWYNHSPETVRAAREWWTNESKRPLDDYGQAVVDEWRTQEARLEAASARAVQRG